MSFEHVSAGVQLFSGAGRLAGELFGFDDLNPFAHIAHFDGAQDTGVVELAHHATGSGVDDVPDRLTHLGDDPVNAGTDATREKAAAAVADTDDMSKNERNAYNEARTGPMKETTVKELKMNGTQIIMADGEKGGVHAKRYLVDLPDDTKVKVFTYEYEGADGKMYQETGYIFETCSNPAVDAAPDQLAETVTEVAPAPVQDEPQPWRQPMVCSGGMAEYYYGLTLSDKGSYATWEEAAQAYIADSYGHAIPENAPDCVIVRVDENGDGIPERLFQVDRHTGKVSDFTITVEGKTIDVSKLPPEEQDLILTGSHDKYQVTVDPTASKSGSLQSTPNPLDTLKLKDGVLYAGGESYAQMADKHMDIFVQDVLQTDTKDTLASADISSGAEGVQGVEHVRQLLSADAKTVMSMSASEIAQRFGLTQDQADNAYDALHRTADRAGSAPEAGESVADYLYRSFGIIVQSPR